MWLESSASTSDSPSFSVPAVQLLPLKSLFMNAAVFVPVPSPLLIGAVCGLVGVGVVLVLGLLKPCSPCGECGAPAPKNWRQPLWGGWTCAGCGCKRTSYGFFVMPAGPP
jgi:hypothetical protein